MPNDISNAVGTARQFTPQPDATYQGRYRDVSPQSGGYAYTQNYDNLADNMARLSQAFQSYAVQHEKYLDAKGLQDATAMVNQESAGAIEKLNAVDAAQVEGYADSLDNPYFKAYAEKLRGRFLSNTMRSEFDTLLQENPDWKKSPDELMKQYSNFALHWKEDHVQGSLAPSNQYAFTTGYNENNMKELSGLVSDWYKNKKQEDIILTTTQVNNDLDDILMNAPKLLEGDVEGKAFKEAVQQALNPARLMGLSLESRIQLIRSFLTKGVTTGSLPIHVLDKQLPNITMQTTADGKTITLGECVDMKGLHADAVNYLSRYNSAQRDEFMRTHSGDYDGALQELEGIKFSDPDRYQLLAPCLPQIKAEEIRLQKEAEQRARADARAKVRGTGSGGRGGYRTGKSGRRRYRSASANIDGTLGAYGGRKLTSTEDVNEFLTAAINGGNMYHGLPLDAYTVKPEVFYGPFTNEIAYLAKNKNFDAIYNLMGTKQAASLRTSISNDYTRMFNSLRIGDDGHAVIDDRAQTTLNSFAENPNAVKDLFGQDVYNNAFTLHSLVKAHPNDMQKAYDDFAQWKHMSNETRQILVKNVREQAAGYTAEGVENLDPSAGSSTVAIMGNPELEGAFLLGASALSGSIGDVHDAINSVGADIAQGYYQYRGAIIPKYLLKGIGTDNDRKNLLDCLSMEMLLENGQYSNSCTVHYNSETHTFTFSDPYHLHKVGNEWRHEWTRKESYIVEGAHDMPYWSQHWAELEQEENAVYQEELREQERQRQEWLDKYRASSDYQIARYGSADATYEHAQDVIDKYNPDATAYTIASDDPTAYWSGKGGDSIGMHRGVQVDASDFTDPNANTLTLSREGEAAGV